MNPRIVVALLALLVSGITAQAENSERMIIYAFQDGPTLLYVGLVDSSPARGFVLRQTSSQPEKAFRFTRQQFEQIWRRLNSSGAEKFAGGKSANRTFDPIKNYVFSVTDMPGGAITHFVVPKTRASGAIVSLARQFEAAAR
jgi:hypothetical protein